MKGKNLDELLIELRRLQAVEAQALRLLAAMDYDEKWLKIAAHKTAPAVAMGLRAAVAEKGRDRAFGCGYAILFRDTGILSSIQSGPATDATVAREKRVVPILWVEQ